MLLEILKRLKHENFYWHLGFYALVLAGTIHFLFLLLFLLLEIPQLVWLNVISISIYLYSIFGIGLRTLERKDDSFIGWLVYIELIGHGVIVTLFLGLESGFQYYIYALVLMPFFVSTYTKKIRILRIIGTIVVILLLELWGHTYEPFVLINDFHLLALHYMNLMFFLVILGGISYIYTIHSIRYRDLLFEKSNRDHLTGLYNRRYISELFQNGLKRRNCDNKSFALMLIDVDYFKLINDQYGHKIGDDVLVNLSTIFQSNVRRSTIVSRWGGEEFLLILEDSNENELKEVGERLRSITATTCMSNEMDMSVKITIGASLFLRNESFEDVLSRVDSALYMGKKNGRDQVVIV